MANPSQIFQSGTAGDNRLFYQNPQGQYAQIASPTELQSLASQGLVQVGGQRGVLPAGANVGINQSSPTPAPTVATDINASGGTPSVSGSGGAPTAGSTGTLETKPGVYSSSSLVDYYQNEIERQRPVFQQAQSALGNIDQQISGLYNAPSLQQRYTDDLNRAVTPIDTQIAQQTNELNQINGSLASIEQDVRSRIAGQAPESYIQALISKEAQPLVNRRQVLQEGIGMLQNQRQQTVSGVERGISLADADTQRRLSILGTQRSLAKDTVDSFNSLIEKGATASADERENARALFTTFLQQSPDFLRSLSQDEVAQMERGIVPYSALQKLGDTIQEQKVSEQQSKRQLVGSGETGYFLIDPATGQSQQVIAPKAGGSGSISESDIRSLANTLYDRDPSITSYTDAYSQAQQMLFGTGADVPTSTPPAQQTPTFDQWASEQENSRGMSLDRNKLRTEYDALQALTNGQTSGYNERVSQSGRRKDDKYLAQVNIIADDYKTDPTVKKYLEQREGYQQSNLIDVNTKNPNDDIALIFSFMKVLDPTSVVRESEFNTAAKAASLLDQFNIKVDKVATGQILNPTVRQNIKDTMSARFNQSQKNYDQVIKTFENRANSAKVDIQDVITDYRSGTNNPTGASSYVQSLYGGGGFTNDPSMSLNGSLGLLSARYESGGNPGAIGHDDTGGWSYGAYQLAHNNAKSFVDQSPYASQFKGISFNSQAWRDKWQQIAKSDPQGFLRAQHNYIAKTHFVPQVLKLASAGFDINKAPQVVKDVVWSTAVQHGPNNDIIKQAIAKTKSGDPAELIRNIYALRWAGGRNFSRSADDVKQSVFNRFFGTQGELNTALATLRNSNHSLA